MVYYNMVENLETALYYIDWKSVIIAIIVMALLIVGGHELWKKIKDVFGIEFKKDRERREEHELLVQTAKNLAALQERHTKDESEFRKNLFDFIDETRKENEKLRDEMRQYSENRVHDREQSFAIQKELTDSIKLVANGQEDRDKQIAALMCGSKELLGDTIDQRYDKYIALKGIPQNEVDEFDDIYAAYKGLNGNHGRETKYKYVKEHLPVIPVKTELIR